MAAGTMKELTAANGDIDTSDQLNMFEAYQKVFIVNGANLKVADFVNTKLSTADVRPNDSTNVAPIKGTILTGGTSGAIMVVDYCNANNGTALIYGYVTSGTFDEAAEVVTGTNASGTPTAISFTLDALPVANPHWYDWTVYPTIGGASFGTMPNKAYLGCLYRGRAVVSGNPEFPYQWYMARQANPWDFAYIANDVQSPVAGGNADAGEIGDIIRALIPYKDDYLIVGCATSVWFFIGDPAAGGTLQELSLTTGIFGANSWCWDDENNFYFWGTNGIYITKVPGLPRNISFICLPELVNDEAVDPSTHRIIMSYDRQRHGLLINITTLSDGINSNYWYDLRTIDESGVGGFFPESYPEECGVYSTFYYAANDQSYRALIVGCKDGYLRIFDDADKSDDIGDSNEAINSYVTFGPLQMAEDSNREGILTSLNVITAGGALNGSQSDSDDVAFTFFIARTAEEVLEKLSANSAPSISKTITAPGRLRGSMITRKVRGAFGGIRMGNVTAAETWGLEKVLMFVKPGGRIK